MSELRDGWALRPLGELGTYVNGRAFKPTEWKERGLPIVRIQNLNDHSAKFNFSDQIHKAKYRVRNGDLLIAWSASLGAFIWERGDAWLNQHIFRVEPNDNVVTKEFLYYAARHAIEELYSKAHGSGMVHVTKPVFESHEVPVPPLDEQRRIVSKLVEVFAKVESCRRRLAKFPVLLKRFRQSVLAAACSGRLTADWREENPESGITLGILSKLTNAHASAGGHKRGNAAAPTDDVHDLETTDFPVDWELTELRNLCEPGRPITYGILKPGPDTPGGVLYVRVADFPNDQLELSRIRRTTKEIDTAYARARLREGDILLSIRGTVGRVCIVPTELKGANITQDSARLTIQDSMEPLFVAWFLRAMPTQRRMQKAIKGVAIRGINIGDVRALQVPIPPRDEQREIVRRVEALFELANQIEARYRKAQTQVDKLTQSILAKAFRGELVPTEAELARRNEIASS
jgi:type I restriction enzyme, S subunit